uniref:TELO2 interacting protein 2 n=1 Tax=Tetraodon nigroviridis TaxID=99883 RepID=H3CK05_TETNG
PVLVFAVTHVQDQPWTDSASRAAARKLQEALLRAGGWRDSAHLLTGDPDSDPESEKNGILGKILDSLQPQMTKTTWQRCEAVKFVYVWVVLQQVSQPFLSPHLPRLLPATLLLADHHRPEISVLGVGCLHHIVLNTPAAELRQWNTAEVVYEALFKHLYATDAAVIQPVLQCLLDLLLVVEKPPCTLRPSASPRKPCRHDDVLRLMLTNMEAEHKVALRRAYASALPAYVARVGVAICRHLRRLERVLLGYLEVPDPPEERSRLDVLQALQTTIRAAWPRWRARGDATLRSLLRFLLDVSSDSDLGDSLRQTLMRQAAVCISLMDHCCHGNLQVSAPQPLLLLSARDSPVSPSCIRTRRRSSSAAGPEQSRP